MAKKARSKTAKIKAQALKSASRKKKTSAKPTSMMETIQVGFDKAAERIAAIFTSEPRDVVEAIKMDHEGLRNYIDVLKDTKVDMSERRRAYVAFSALLKSHSESEERAVYANSLTLVGRELHNEIREGFVEHRVAEDLMKRLEKTKDPMEWSAHAQVLAEVVEHHIKEEEDELLPMIRDAAKPAQNMEMLAEFLSLRGKTQKRVSKKNAGVLEMGAH